MATQRKATRKKAVRRTPARLTLFCSALTENGGNVAEACKAAKIRRETAYRWREEDTEFAAAWDAAKAIGLDSLEDECLRRAFRGNLKPIYHQGEKVGTVREYSDTLAIFLLKGGKPGKYRDNAKIEHTGVVTLEQLVLQSLKSDESAGGG